jgi:DNA transformation protein and related proteins
VSTSKSTIDYILDQISRAGDVRARKMFGEYALYCNGKVVGLVCDDILYLKITVPGKEYAGDFYQEGYAYPGAKVSMLIDGDRIEDSEWLSELVRITADNVAPPKQKKLRK